MIATVVVPLVAVVLTLAGGWLITTRVSDHWDQVKRRRETDLAAAEEFQRLYGEIFAVWKIWNAIPERKIEIKDSAEARWDCLKRTADIEGRVEALLAKISAERELSPKDKAALGAVRQGFQSLRNAIEKDEPLPWWGSEVEPYAAFKDLAVYTSGLLSASSISKRNPSRDDAAKTFRQITSNKHEKSWVQTAQDLQLVESSPRSGPQDRVITS
jgi:hypothetical protein